MKRLGSSVALFLVALGSPSVAEKFAPLLRGDQPLEGFGFAINTPQGSDWMVMPAVEGHLISFYRYIGKRKDRQTGVAFVGTNWVTDCDDHASCLAKSVELARTGVEGIKVVSLELSRDGVKEPSCSWMDKVEDDQRSKKRPFEVRAAGLICTHPDEPTLIIQPIYTERFKKGDKASHDVGAEARAFIDSFQFRPIRARVASTIEIGEGSGYIEPNNGSLWIHGRDSILEVDLASRQVWKRFDSPSNRFPIAVTKGSVWSPIKKRQLLRLQPTDGTVQARIDLSIRPYTVKKGFGSLWVTAAKGSLLVRIDPDTNRVASEIEVGEGLAELAIGKTSVWISQGAGSQDLVRRIDPSTNSVVKSFRPCLDPLGIERGAEHLWIACYGGTVVRIDPATYDKIGSVAVGGRPALLDSDDSTVWVTHFGLGTVTAIDNETMTVIANIPLGKEMRYVQIVGDSAWVTDFRDGKVYEVKRLKQ